MREPKNLNESNCIEFETTIFTVCDNSVAYYLCEIIPTVSLDIFQAQYSKFIFYFILDIASVTHIHNQGGAPIHRPVKPSHEWKVSFAHMAYGVSLLPLYMKYSSILPPTLSLSNTE